MRNLYFILILFITSISFSQNIKFDGVIADAKAVPLEMANVMAVNQATKAVDAYSITNDKGKFQLNLKANSTYAIKISYIGYQSVDITVATTTENINKVITLEEGTQLDEVEIVREMPVSIHGDTISYNADSFKTGTERKLEDVLKKLPGVEVNADGEVEVEGKKVTKLMVEGKDFFDGDTKLGVKNIPADAIDKVQVLRNYNENSILKGVENNQDNVAMNIKLKNGKKNFWFGDMTAGGGIDDKGKADRYIINPKLFYYSPKYSINVISNFNNIGELPLTIQDYFKFTGGFRNMMGKGGSSFNVSSNDLGISLLRNNRAKEIDTKFGATNFSYNPTKSWTLSGFGILSSSITDLETKAKTNFLQPNSSDIASTENRQEVAHQKNSLGLFKLSSSYKPNANFQFDYDILGKLSKQEEVNSLLRETVINTNSNSENINTAKNQAPTSVNQNLSFYYTASEKNVFALEMQHLYQDEDPFYNANLASDPFTSPTSNILGYDTAQIRTDLNQNRFVKTNKLDAKLDYYYMLTPKSNINITFGNTYSNQTFNSSMYQILDNGNSTYLANEANYNDVNYRFNDAFLGAHYKMLSGKFTFTPGISAHNYSMDNQQLGTDYKLNFTRLLPDLFVLYQIKKAETLTYNFSFTNNFTDINKLAEGYVLNSYNTLSKGNRLLENSTSQTHSLRYFKYNMFNFENIFAYATYSRTIDAVKSRFRFDGVNQASSPINSNFADEAFSAMGNYGRSFARFYKASLSANINWSKFNNLQFNPLTNTDIAISNESFTQNYAIEFSTNFKKLPNIEIGYNYLINEYQGNTFYTDKPSVKLDYFFLKSFSFVSEYEFYHYYNNDRTTENEYDFLSASLIYQKTKDSKWEYKLSGTNLLNTTSLNDDSFNQNIVRTSQYRVQPRYVILSLKYNL
ncbi:carboxypeptidase-like regulatory domain-containing protein [Flavobacterium paronense]|uniref:Carboxypeptidase-like regulatory domain-containing protein n=1 Tax=Flavobacterium paronense TaxID=1392775 RepID=A0ABV5GDP7_9FLAO|nr:carboxypeptidase-like regulatory domain-containing protein [Flavobacterium paronense]MDN3678041.1 carboxypeptidase-like regulatory domain-containing protein [Flavobacterium paronense]